MSKYEGDLIKSLMWAVDKVTKNVNNAPPCDPQPVADESGTANRATGLPGGKESIVVDYAAEFDRSRHAVSIEQSREAACGCDEPNQPDDE